MSNYQIIGLSYAFIGILTCLVLAVEYRKKKTLNLSELPISNAFIWITRILVALLFIYSGFVKANDYIGFGYKLGEYFEEFGTLFMLPFAEPLAFVISTFEIALAFALLFGFQMRWIAWILILMMVFFTFLTGYSSITGHVTDCGCFGDALKIEPWESFTKDIILLSMLIPVFIVRKYIKPIPTQTVAGLIFAFTWIISLAFGYYCHENLPVIDYRAYKVGVDVKACSDETQGIPKCKDYYAMGWVGEMPKVDELQGNVVMIISYDLETANPQGLAKITQLADKLQGTDIQILCGTGSGSSAIEQIQKTYTPVFGFSKRDKKAMKTIVRSNPGIVLLKDGIIKGKWHHNNTPTVEELREKL